MRSAGSCDLECVKRILYIINFSDWVTPNNFGCSQGCHCVVQFAVRIVFLAGRPHWGAFVVGGVPTPKFLARSAPSIPSPAGISANLAMCGAEKFLLLLDCQSKWNQFECPIQHIKTGHLLWRGRSYDATNLPSSEMLLGSFRQCGYYRTWRPCNRGKNSSSGSPPSLFAVPKICFGNRQSGVRADYIRIDTHKLTPFHFTGIICNGI